MEEPPFVVCLFVVVVRSRCCSGSALLQYLRLYIVDVAR